ncbi:DMT family transporter [Granulosicoccaceae sp. 1_MG-2023]|nr:DMT family transporter [Granulosicoccaceae sp. 1_MG-2023]
MTEASKPRAGAVFFANPYLLLALTTLFWGGNAVAGKMAVGEVSVIALTFFRWVGALLLVLPFARKPLMRDLPQVKKHFLLLFGLGAVGFTGFNLTMYWALTYTSVVNVVIEQAAIPVLIMLFNFVAFRLRVRLLQIVGLIMALAGVVLTVTGGRPGLLLQGQVNIGDAIMMLAALCYAVYSIGLRWRPAMHWLSFLTVLVFAAALVSGVFWLAEVWRSGVVWPSGKGLWLVAYVAFFPSLLSQLFFARGVDLIGANRAGLFINLVPIFGSLLAILLLGERFHWYHAAGLLLVIGGIFLAERAARRVT